MKKILVSGHIYSDDRYFYAETNIAEHVPQEPYIDMYQPQKSFHQISPL